MIYADAAATTPLSQAAFEAMKPWAFTEYANAAQPYSLARKPKKALAQARELIAERVGAEPDEIFFTSGGTESDNWALKGSAFADPAKRTTITSAFEHHAVLRSCQTLERLGYPVVYLAPSASGVVSVETLRDAITKSGAVRLVSIMFANNEIGSVQPIQELADVARAAGATFHTDAVQAVGRMKIDVRELGVDMLSASAHKFNGPKGVGFLYLRRGVTIAPYLDGGSQERGMRAGTENVAAVVGMATALKENCAALDANAAKIRDLERRLLDGLRASARPFVRNGAGATGACALPGLLSLSFPGFDGEAILHRMDLAGVCVSTGAACNGADAQISHVLQAIGLDERLAKGTIRISLSKENSVQDVDAIVRILTKILEPNR